MPKEQELIARIKELESELARTKKQRRYGLVWEDKKEDVVERCKHELPVLLADESKTLSDNPNGPTNILIEGDNFHALSVLAYTHDKKIDVIYIDPPYNTGNKDFVYNDVFVEKEDTYRHSKWLSYIEKRLKIATLILKDSGVIIISIDDNEQATVKLLCDGILGPDNFIACLPTVMNLKGNQDEFGFAGTHEYTLVYAKNKSFASFGKFPVKDEESLEDWKEDSFGLYKLGTLKGGGVNGSREKRPNLYFPIFIKKNGDLYVTNNDKILDKNDFILLPLSNGREMTWRWSKQKIQTEPHNIDVDFDRVGQPNIFRKIRPGLGEVPSEKPKTIFYKPEYSSGNGTNLLKKIFGKDRIFTNPKPLQLIYDLLQVSSKKDSIILDFFAGSGTTGHAVLELNKEDRGNRQFILCTNNENQIAEEVTYPRIHNVIKGYAGVEGIPANLRYYRTDFISNDKSIDDLRHKFILRCSEMLQIRESCFDVSALNGDEYFQVFENKDLVLAILYHPYEIKRLREIISETEKPIVAYIFSMGMEIFQEELAEYGDKVRIETVPDEILETYKKIFGF